MAARNALITDFSPDRLVFGHNLALPNVPVLEPITTLSLKIMRDTLQAMNAAKQ